MGHESVLPNPENEIEQDEIHKEDTATIQQATFDHLNANKEKILSEFEGSEKHKEIAKLVGNLNEFNQKLELLNKEKNQINRDELIKKITPVVMAVVGVAGVMVGEVQSVLNTLGATLIVLGYGGGTLYEMLTAAQSRENRAEVTDKERSEVYCGDKLDSALFELERFVNESRAIVEKSLIEGGATWETRVGADGKEYQSLNPTENQIEYARWDAAKDGIQISR